MARYKTRGHEIQAEQFFLGQPLPFRDVGPVVSYEDGVFSVETIDGNRIPLNDGDWVILEPGSTTCAYPCRPTIFEARYEPCKDAPADKPVALRVQDEKRELDERIERLQRFIGDCSQPSEFLRLLPADQSSLRLQLTIMRAYSAVLGERLAHMV